MRQGAVVHETATAATSPRALAEQMVGRSVALSVTRAPARPGEVLLEARDLEVRDHLGVARLRGVSLALRAGEIVGVAGVSGNGQSELMEVLAGMHRPASGTILFLGKTLDLDKSGPRDRRALGIAHVPEDRLRMGVVTAFSAEDNLILGYQGRPSLQTGPFLGRAAVRAACGHAMEAFDVRPRDPSLRISAFSGGNQQKLVLAREMDLRPSVLIVGQPTRGVDIGAIEFIHRRIVALRDEGRAVLMVSVELDEIMALSDRILVMAGGEIVGELKGEGATEEAIGLLMAGVRAEAGA
ncbi:MAG TPA: ATP-binding cassette domain-containing protein, partial [Opitutaceae bacterium]|jgi:simple sugar transport system ATP-binding protein